MHATHTRSFSGIATAMAIALTLNGHGATLATWTNAAGGDFFNAANWKPNAVPVDTSYRAVFDLDNLHSNPCVITWSQNVTNESFDIKRGRYIFNLGGHTYRYGYVQDSQQHDHGRL